jgi:hypothetical protein
MDLQEIGLEGLNWLKIKFSDGLVWTLNIRKP